MERKRARTLDNNDGTLGASWMTWRKSGQGFRANRGGSWLLHVRAGERVLLCIAISFGVIGCHPELRLSSAIRSELSAVILAFQNSHENCMC